MKVKALSFNEIQGVRLAAVASGLKDCLIWLLLS